MFRVSLYTKVLGAFLLLSLLPLVLLLFSSQHSLREVEQLLREQTTAVLDEQAVAVLEGRARMVSRQVADLLGEVEGNLIDLSLIEPDADKYLTFSLAHQRRVGPREETNAAVADQSIPLFSELAYVDARGYERIRIVADHISTNLRRVSDPGQTTYLTEDYFHRAASLPAGSIWVSHLNGWYVDGSENISGIASVVPPYEGVIRFATPVKRGGELLGIVVVSLDHRHLLDLTQDLHFALKHDEQQTSGDSYLFDDQGWIIAHADPRKIRGFNPRGQLMEPCSSANAQAQAKGAQFPFNLLAADFIDPHYSSIVAAVRQGESGVVDIATLDGTHKMMAYAPISYERGPYREFGVFGGVTIGIESSRFHQSASQTAQLIGHEVDSYLFESWLVISLTVLFVAGVAFMLSKSIVRPVVSLTEGTRKMISGSNQEQVRVETTSTDEVGVLAESFNVMVEELNGRSQKLQKTLQALRKSRKEIIRERNFKNTVFDNIDLGLLTFDRNCKLTSANGTACQVLQTSAPDRDSDWLQLLDGWPELTQVLEKWFRRAETDASQTFKTYVTPVRNGRQLTYRMALFPLSFRKQSGWLLIIEDITERVNMRQQIARMDRLASLGRMSAGIAHEVRNPLTGVSLLLDELHDRLLGHESDQLLIRRALGEIERLETLVTEMLRFASMPEPKISSAQIENVIEETLFLVRKQLQRKQIKLTEDVAQGLPPIEMDADRIKQVLLNLFNNAIDAMPDGGKLAISVRQRGGQVVVRVADTGCGIAADRLPLVFEPFFTSKGHGTGLGLAISYNIISEHGGEINIESHQGEGTVVAVSLPLQRSPHDSLYRS